MDFLQEEAIRRISTALMERPHNEITGALLGELCRKVAPELNIREVVGTHRGPGALSKFVQLHLNNILIPTRQQGADWVYSIKSNASMTPNTNTNYWRTFASPNSPNHLAIQNNSLIIENNNTEGINDDKSSIKIQSITSEELNLIRKGFIDSLSSELNEEQLKTIDPDITFNLWLINLRNLGHNIYKKWGEFRATQMLDIFCSRLNTMDITEETKSSIRRELKISQSAGKIAPPTPAREETALSPLEKSHFSNDTELLRKIIVDAIMAMPISDLREIKIPAGAVLDALKPLIR